MSTCRHCECRETYGGYRTCSTCRRIPGMTAYYRHGLGEKPRLPAAPAKREPYVPQRLPAKQPGDAEYRCTWCCFFRCEHPLELCLDCRAWYRRNSNEMPVGREEEVAVA